MTKDRQIVAMLIRRKRRALRQLNRAYELDSDSDAYKLACNAWHTEAHNAAELARRILYGTEL